MVIAGLHMVLGYSVNYGDSTSRDSMVFMSELVFWTLVLCLCAEFLSHPDREEIRADDHSCRIGVLPAMRVWSFWQKSRCTSGQAASFNESIDIALDREGFKHCTNRPVRQQLHRVSSSLLKSLYTSSQWVLSPDLRTAETSAKLVATW